MHGKTRSSDVKPSHGRVRRWLVRFPRAVPLMIFFAIAAVTGLSVFAIESNVRQGEQVQMREYAQSIASSLDRRGNASAAYLRAAAALFANTPDFSPVLFRQFASELRLNADYPGVEGMGWAEAVDPARIAQYLDGASARRVGISGIEPTPGEQSEQLAIVTFLLPDTERNRRALGFDMNSEATRRAAMEQADRFVRPTASGQVTLRQDGEFDAPGFEVFMPVYGGGGADRELKGFVFIPFNAVQFLEAALDPSVQGGMSVRLYDRGSDTENLLAESAAGDASGVIQSQRFQIANRPMELVVEAPLRNTLEALSMVTLLFGLAMALLLMMLARLLTKQAVEDASRLAFFEEQNSIRNSLTRELNHRVKNTLANVLSILALTRRRTDNLDVFADGLAGRIRALSATHDLLTLSDWSTTQVGAVIKAELAHFDVEIGGEVTLDGPPVELAPNDALSFGMAIHELATNAAKYGALSNGEGRVSIIWTLLDAKLAEVEWRETGGPPVSQERGRGFGTELIEKIVAHELKYPVKLEFEAQGVRCVLRVPVRRRSSFRIREQAG